MANYTAADVMRLRKETDAPVMECKTALEEADGDFDKAKQLLREKGKAAAQKRSDRKTGAGVVAFSASTDGKTVGAVVLESETDFVAKNAEFIKIAQEIADMYRDQDPGADPMAVAKNGKSVKEIVEDAVGKIRENIRVSKALRLTSPGGVFTYLHHDNTKGAVVIADGNGDDSLRIVAIQVVSNRPEVVSKDQLPQAKIEKEIEIETQRAILDGKDEKMARNIATGRVNKEYVKSAVLLEQPFYKDPSKSVQQFLQESGKDAKVADFVYLGVGED